MSVVILCAISLPAIALCAGVVAAVFVAYFLAKKRGYYEDIVFDVVLACVIPGLIGARAGYATGLGIAKISADVWTFAGFFGYGQAPTGLSEYGAIVGMALGALILVVINRRLLFKNPDKYAYRKVSYLQIADLTLCVFILVTALGKAGDISFSDGNALKTAAAVFGCFWNAAAFAFLVWSYSGRRKSFDGFILCAYLILSGLGNVICEGIYPSGAWLVRNVINVTQISAAISLLAGIVGILTYLIAAGKTGGKPFVFVQESVLDDGYYGYLQSRIGKPSLGNGKNEYTDKIEFEETPDDDKYWEIPDAEISDEERTDGKNAETDGENENG